MWLPDNYDADTGTRFFRTVSEIVMAIEQSFTDTFAVIEFGAMWSHGLHSGGV